jgi:hypothetical protein
MSVVCAGQRGLIALLTAVLVAGTAPLARGQEAADEPTDIVDSADVEDVPQVTIQKPVVAQKIKLPKPKKKKRKPVADAYAAQGIGSDVFRFYPTLEIGAVATSNVSRSSTKAKSDLAVRLRPSISFASNWSRHSWTGSASADFLRYRDTKSQSNATASAQTALRLDIHHDTRANLAAGYSRTAIASGTGIGEVPLTALGSRVDQGMTASAALEHDVGPLTTQLRLGLIRNTFGDVDLSGGGSEDNADRDYTEVSALLRGSFNRGAVFSPYAEIAYEPRFHDKAKDRNGVKRDSQGLRLGVGVALDDGPVWSGEIGASLQLRRYADASLDNVVVPGLSARVTWRPTDLTRFEFNTGATVAETVVAGSSANRSWNGNIDVVHALRDNIDLSAGLGLAVDKTSTGTDLTTSTRVGVSWLVNPYLTWTTGYEGTYFNGATGGSDYQEHRILSSIILKR